MGAENECFNDDIKILESKFDSKPRTQPPLSFARITITQMEGDIYKL